MQKLASFLTHSFIFAAITIFLAARIANATSAEENIPKLENPITAQYLKKNLRKSQPRLVLNSNIEKQLKTKLKSDPVVQNMYEAVKLNANSVFEKPLLERAMVGRRLLGTSREMLWRMNMLGMVYRMEKDSKNPGKNQ
jgi:uncharacterized membrane protein